MGKGEVALNVLSLSLRLYIDIYLLQNTYIIYYDSSPLLQSEKKKVNNDSFSDAPTLRRM